MSKPTPSQSRVRRSLRWKTVTKNDRQHREDQHGRDIGRKEEVVEDRVQRPRHDKAGDEDPHSGAAVPVGEHLRDHGEDRSDPAVHDRRAETADHPQCQTAVLEDEEIARVLHQREAGADREAEDGGVDQETDCGAEPAETR